MWLNLALAVNTALTVAAKEQLLLENAELRLEKADLRKKLDEANERIENYRHKLKESADSLTTCLMKMKID